MNLDISTPSAAITAALAIEGHAADSYTEDHLDAPAPWADLDEDTKDRYRIGTNGRPIWLNVDPALLLEEGTAAQLHALDHPLIRPYWNGLRADIRHTYRVRAQDLLESTSIVYRAYAAQQRVLFAAGLARPQPQRF